MKKFLFSALTLMAGISVASSQELVKTIYDSDPVNVTWENTLKFDASDFSDIAAGNYIHITFSRTSDVIELKSNGAKLPGTLFTSLGDATTEYKAYITPDMLTALQSSGLELCGANFTVSGVSIMNDGFVMPEGAIWGGYFWVDNWNTMELWKEAFANYDGQRYMDIYISDDRDGDSNYYVKVLQSWEEGGTWADNDVIAHETTKATVDLKDIDVANRLATTDRIMIQGNKEAGNPFNIKAIALRHDDITTGIEDIATDNNPDRPVNVYNLQGMTVRQAVAASNATTDLPAGLYIVDGRKVLVR